VARLSKAAAGQWLPRVERIESARILAMLRRRRTDGDPAYRDAYRCETWEYPLVELVWDAR
jgi:ATP-dependent DNA helicase RecQ